MFRQVCGEEFRALMIMIYYAVGEKNRCRLQVKNSYIA